MGDSIPYGLEFIESSAKRIDSEIERAVDQAIEKALLKFLQRHVSISASIVTCRISPHPGPPTFHAEDIERILHD